MDASKNLVRIAALLSSSDDIHVVASQLVAVAANVYQTLYVVVDDKSFFQGRDISDKLKKRLEILEKVYFVSTTSFPELDVRVLFADGFSSDSPRLQYDVEVAFVDRAQTHEELLLLLKMRLSPLCDMLVETVPPVSPDLLAAATNCRELSPDASANVAGGQNEALSRAPFANVILGGTFDHFHNGHRLLLAAAATLCNRELVVGIAEGKLLERKTLAELIEPTSVRMDVVLKFIQDIVPRVEHSVVAITDMAGPAGVRSDLDCLVLSQETLPGGQFVNLQRQKKGLPPLMLHTVDLVGAGCDKLSSTELRRRDLGQLRPYYIQGKVNVPWMSRLQLSVQQHQMSSVEGISHLPEDVRNIRFPTPGPLQTNPYTVGLTGGLVSGKSHVANCLKALGAVVISADALVNQVYMPGTDCYNTLVEEFGEDVVGDDGTIDRKELGRVVFNSRTRLERLNAIVWPAVGRMVMQQLVHHASEMTKLVVVETALLHEGGFEKVVDEVWTTMVPPEEAIRRLRDNFGFSHEKAFQRVHSQTTNSIRMQNGHVVLSPLWEHRSTDRDQVVPAWKSLQKRMNAFRTATIGRTFAERWEKVVHSARLGHTVGKEWLDYVRNLHQPQSDGTWQGEDSVIRKLNQCDCLLPYLESPALVQVAIFFSTGGLVHPLDRDGASKCAVEAFENLAEKIKLPKAKRDVVVQLLSTAGTRPVPANTDVEYFRDLEITEDCRLLATACEPGLPRPRDERISVLAALRDARPLLRTPQMRQLLGKRVEEKLAMAHRHALSKKR